MVLQKAIKRKPAVKTGILSATIGNAAEDAPKKPETALLKRQRIPILARAVTAANKYAMFRTVLACFGFPIPR